MNIQSNTQWLIEAAISGNTEDLKRLIPISDPNWNGSWALQMAAFYRCTECVDLLFDVSNPSEALRQLQAHAPNKPELWRYLADKIASAQQKEVLKNEVALEFPPNV